MHHGRREIRMRNNNRVRSSLMQWEKQPSYRQLTDRPTVFRCVCIGKRSSSNSLCRVLVSFPNQLPHHVCSFFLVLDSPNLSYVFCVLKQNKKRGKENNSKETKIGSGYIWPLSVINDVDDEVFRFPSTVKTYKYKEKKMKKGERANRMENNQNTTQVREKRRKKMY